MLDDAGQELERARAEEKAALSRRKPTSGPEKAPAKPLEQYVEEETLRGTSTSEFLYPEEVVGPQRALSSGWRLPGEPRTPRQPRRCFF